MKAVNTFCAVVLLTVSAVTHASSVEVWECKDRFERAGAVLATATVESGREKGTISVAGIKHPTEFGVTGFNRRWDFVQSPSGGFQYSFIIEPNGDAKYYEFKGELTAKPTNLMKCRQVSAAGAAS